MSKNRAEELRDALGAPTALDDSDDRSFEQQMDDLGVKVIKPERPRPEWYEPDMRRNNKTGIKDKIIVMKSGLTIGQQAMQILRAQEGDKLKIGMVKIKKGPVIAIRHNKTGLKICKTRANSFRVGTKKLYEWLDARGIKEGLYELKEIEGGFLAVPGGGAFGG